jgi:hypothetical protein
MQLEQRMSLLRDAGHFLNSYGIPSIVELTGDLPELEVFAALRDGELTNTSTDHLRQSRRESSCHSEFFAELDKLASSITMIGSRRSLSRFFSDGVGNPPPMFYDPADYKQLVVELDKRQIVTHAIGARAVHMVTTNWKRPMARQTGAYAWNISSPFHWKICLALPSSQSS